MWVICRKEWQQFFSSWSNYIVLAVFLMLCGVIFFVLPDTSLLDFGYAGLDSFFALAPLILLFLVPAITMRSLSEEYKSGTIELLKTLPFTNRQIVWGKYMGALIILLAALLPTTIYAFSMQQLSATGGIDVGAAIGSYIGLYLLGAVFAAAGICAGSFSQHTIVAFATAALLCIILYSGFDAISKLPVFTSKGWDYYVQMLGAAFHYRHISRGVIDVRDLIYFVGLIALFLFITQKKLETI